MKRLLVLLLLVCPFAFGQIAPPNLSKVAGQFVASSFGQWRASTLTPIVAGVNNFTVSQGEFTTTDGRTFSPWSTLNPFTVDIGTPNAETVTPTVVGQCNVPGSCIITATFLMPHAQGAAIGSSTQGVQDAVSVAAQQSAGVVVIDAPGMPAPVTPTPNNVTIWDYRTPGAICTWAGGSTVCSAPGGGGVGITPPAKINSFLAASCNPIAGQDYELVGCPNGPQIGTASNPGPFGIAFCPSSAPCTVSGLPASAAAPSMGFYFSANCQNTANCTQTFADTNIDGTCNITSGSATISCTDTVFAPGDIGKQIMVYANSCAAFSSGVSFTPTNSFTGSTTVVTISTFTNSTQISASATANQTVTNHTACVVWGHPDDTAAATFSTAVLNAPQCPRAMLASANYMFSKPPAFLYQQPTSCTQIPTLVNGALTLGNVLYSGGYEVEGRGVGPTTLYLTNNFPNGDACNHGPSGASACFVQPLEGRWLDFQISGGGEYNAPGLTAGTTLIYLDGPGSTDNFTCTNYGGNHGNGEDSTVGVVASNWERLSQVNISGCGTVALNVLASSYVWASKVSLENSAQAELEVTGPTAATNLPNFNCFDCNLYAAQMHISGSGQFSVIYNGGGLIHLYGGSVTDGSTGVTNAIIGYDGGSSGATLIAEGTVFSLAGDSSSNETSIDCVAACTNYFRNVSLTARGTGKTYIDGSSSSILYDQGGNSLGPTTVTVSGSILGSSSIGGLVGNLPACSATRMGQTATVTDGTPTTFASTLTGSGTHKSLGYCNGTNWTLAAQ